MKEIKDNGQLQAYMNAYRINSIFPEPLRPYLSLYSFERGELICSQGDALPYLYVLVKGKIKIYTTSPEGKSLIVSFKTPLEMVGDIEFVQGTDMINTVEAVSPVHMIGVHCRWLNQYGRDHAPLLQFFLKIITQKFSVKSRSLSFNLMYPVEVRLAGYLLSVSYDEADSMFQGQLGSADLKDAANLIGTSYRHLNRVIRQFCMEGLTERTKTGIVVKDKAKLMALAGSNIYE